MKPSAVCTYILVSVMAVTGSRGLAAGTPVLIEEMLGALGGRDAISELHSLAVEADCTGPDGGFRTRIESLLPGSTYFEQASNEGTTRIWSTAARTWYRDNEGSIRELGSEVRSFVRSHEFHLLLFQVDSRFTNHRAAESGVDGSECQVILMDQAETGEPASICISPADKLPLYMELNSPGAAGPVRTSFRDWRLVDGLYYFFAFTLTEGDERTFTYEYNQIEPNGVDDGRFVVPESRDR